MPNDHDLLIRLDENMRNLASEVKMIRDGTFARITDVEKNKLDVSQFASYKEENEKSIKALFGITEKQSDKIAKQSYFVYIGIGIVITLQFIAIIVASGRA